MQYFHVYLIQVENDYKRQRSQGQVQSKKEMKLHFLKYITLKNIETVCTCN